MLLLVNFLRLSLRCSAGSFHSVCKPLVGVQVVLDTLLNTLRLLSHRCSSLLLGCAWRKLFARRRLDVSCELLVGRICVVVIAVLLEKRMRIEENLVEDKNDDVAGEGHHLCQGEYLGVRSLLLYSALRPNV